MNAPPATEKDLSELAEQLRCKVERDVTGNWIIRDDKHGIALGGGPMSFQRASRLLLRIGAMESEEPGIAPDFFEIGGRELEVPH